MKTIKILFFAILLIGFSTNSYAVVSKVRGNNKAVGAPLDGGLLSILGVAGVSYYLVRKKQNLK